MEDLSGLVDAAALETEFYLPAYVVHRRYDTNPGGSVGYRRPVEEIWDVREEIGEGGYGAVHRQEVRNPQPTTPASVRAVKTMRKIRRNEPQWQYRAELQAIVKFSQPEACSSKRSGSW